VKPVLSFYRIAVGANALAIHLSETAAKKIANELCLWSPLPFRSKSKRLRFGEKFQIAANKLHVESMT